MPDYAYEALEKSGRMVRGVIAAGSEDAILERLRDMGYYPVRVAPHRHAGGGFDLLALPVLRAFFHRIKPVHIMTFTRQLATLVEAGLPIMRSLSILREQVESAVFKHKITAMARDIESGGQLSEAMSHHPRVFDRLYVNMVRAGEVGGVLEEVLTRIADYLERREAIKGKVKSALAYPAVVSTLAALIVSFILIMIIPKFTAIYAQLGANLPWPTLVLVRLSSILLHQVWIVILGIAACTWAARRLHRRPLTRFYCDLALLRLPALGEVFRKVAVARFASTLSTLVGAGLPILQALDIVRDSTGNEVIARAMDRVYQSVREGEPIHATLAQCPVFPPLVVHMLAVGEETGAIDLMLAKVAEAYEREVDATVDALASIIEPVMLVLLGILIGGIVIALYLPLFEMLKHIAT